MRAVDINCGPLPYLVFHAQNPTLKKPTPRQLGILSQMTDGIWYEVENTDWRASVGALVDRGWLLKACVSEKNEVGELMTIDAKKAIIDVLLSGKPFPQPWHLYRKHPRCPKVF